MRTSSVNSLLLRLLCCAFFLTRVCCSRSERTQCAQRHFIKALDFPDFFSDYCRVTINEESLKKTNCTVWDYAEENDYYDCSDLTFSSTPSSYALGTEIYPYVDKFPNFNISFRDVKWNYMRYRLQVDKSKLCHSVLFNSSEALQHTPSVSFACRWFGTWAAERSYDAELFVNVGVSPSHITGYAHYLIRVPQRKKFIDPSNELVSIKEWIILVAVEDSRKPHLLVYWPTVPDRYNVSEYNVRILNDEPKVVNLASCHDGYCSCELFAGYFARNVSVSVQPVHVDCRGSCNSYSPNITLVTCVPLYYTIPAGFVPILILLVLIFSVYYYCCTVPREPVKVLLLFDATTRYHLCVVYEFVKHLKDECGVRCLVDFMEIPYTESQNPSKWLHKTIDEVVAVLYVASPPSHMDIRFSSYPNVVYEALTLIQQRRSNQSDHRPDNILVAVPPYCSKENIPQSLLDAPRFYIPDELNWLLWSLYNKPSPVTCLGKAYLRCGWCPGPMSAYEKHGTRLKKALGFAKAHKITEEEKPLDIGSWIGSGTFIGGESEKDTETIYQPPWNLDSLWLSGKPEGSLLSQDSVQWTVDNVPKMAIDLSMLDLQCGLQQEDF